MAPRARRNGAARVPSGTRALLRRALSEDRIDRDITTRALFPNPRRARARVLAESACVVSGLDACRELGRMTGVRVTPLVRDGETVRRGAIVLSLEGDVRTILSIERTLLNLLMHLSGVATATRRAVRAVAGPGSPEVYGTRKTLPGLRALEKASIRHGGGRPHRSDLAEALLVKNNHLAFYRVRAAVARLKGPAGRGRPVEVEVRNRRDALAAVAAGADALLIDNASPRQARAIARAVRARPRSAPVWIEVSGGLTPDNVGRYRRVGADAASLGSITHSAPAVPFHLRIVRDRAARRPVAST
jgi:nicotinate-nucleotide pyrophosphorylase (carboxylating)